MKSKKEKKFILAIFLVLVLPFIFLMSAQTDTKSLEKKLQELEGLRDIGEIEKWEYLGKRWKEILLQNTVVEKINSIFLTIDGLRIFDVGIFYFFLAEDYDLSLIFFFSLIFFILFLNLLKNVFKFSLPFDQRANVVLAVAFAVVLSHLQFYSFLSKLTFGLLFYREGVWGLIWTLIFFIVYLTVFVFLKNLTSMVASYFKGLKKSKREKALEKKVERSERFIRGVEGGYDSLKS